MTTNRMGLTERQDDYGLNAQLEVLEALTTPDDTENQQLICLLLELKRRRANAVLDEAERAELLAYREASKEPVAWRCNSGMFAALRVVTLSPIVADSWAAKGVEATPLFEAPPIQVVTVPDEKRTFSDNGGCMIYTDYDAGWNACRVAMLKRATK